MSPHAHTPVFSFWAWLILAPPLITVWGGYTTAASPQERLAGLLAAVVVHLILGGCFWLANLVERRLPNPWRWVWFLVVLLVISVVRPTVADLLQNWSGPNLETPAFGIRVALNIVGLGVVMAIVYFALQQVTRAADSRRRLAAVLAHTEQQRAATEVRQAALIVEYQRRIADPIRRALAQVQGQAKPAKIAEQLMRLAHDVVRPLADQTFAMAHDATEYQYRPPSGPVVTDRARRTTPQRIEATLPWGPVAMWFVMQLPVAFLTYDNQLLGIGITVASTAITLLGCWLIRLQPLPASSGLAIVLLAIEYALIGAVGTLVFISPHPGAYTLGYWAYGMLTLCVTGTILSIARSRQLDYLATDQQLVDTLLEARFRANTAHAQLASTTNLLARRLHAAIQTDVVAAAFQIRMGTADPVAVVAELCTQVERVLAAPMLPSEVDTELDLARPFPEGIRAATEAADQAWRQGLELATDYEEGLWLWLANHPEQRAFVREVATKGLTNIIRYGRVRRATLIVRVEEDRLRIEVRSPGRILPKDERLSGMAVFTERAYAAEFVQEGSEVVHRVIA